MSELPLRRIVLLRSDDGGEVITAARLAAAYALLS